MTEAQVTETRETLPGLGGVLVEDVQRVVDEAGQRRASAAARDRKICVCGHPVRSHSGQPGQMLCKPTKMECPCPSVQPVLRVRDTRKFVWVTTGPGASHALALGLAQTIAKNLEYEWLVELRCFACEEENDLLSPVAVTAGGAVSHHPEKVNGLLCPRCFGQLKSDD